MYHYYYICALFILECNISPSSSCNCYCTVLVTIGLYDRTGGNFLSYIIIVIIVAIKQKKSKREKDIESDSLILYHTNCANNSY